MTVRTRFAPSPTGMLHLGGARTALFNYLFTRHEGGTFILRIEDTDRERSTPEAIQVILDGLTWLGLTWDEGPYHQTERAALYREHVERLLERGAAYRCYCTAAELDAMRQAATAAKRKPMYDRRCRDRAPQPGDAERPHTVRFKAPLEGETALEDLVKGRVAFPHAELDDLIIARTDGSATYNLTVVVDDATMAITHVLRGEDHLNNTFKQVQLYRALDYDLPRFGHVPLIHGADGAKLSKRHGAVAVTAYRDMGYLPDAMVNYLARLGWSHGDQELFTRAELIDKFSLDALGTSAASFDPEKLAWVNFEKQKALAPEALADAIRPFVAARGWPIRGDAAWLARVAASLQERAHTLVELVDMAHYFFRDQIEIDPKARDKHLANADRDALRDLRERLATCEWTLHAIEAAFQAVLAARDLKLGKLAQPVRVALTGGTTSPGIYDVVEIVGRERVLQRLDEALADSR